MEQSHVINPHDDIDCIRTALRWIQEGRKTALACVTQTWGSAPRPIGSFLAMNDNGDFVGSVSGGCIEGEVATRALGLMRTQSSTNIEFAVSDEQATGAGLACGGKVSVHVFFVSDAARQCLTEMLEKSEQKEATALTIDLSSGSLNLVDNDPTSVVGENLQTVLERGQPATVVDDDVSHFVRPFLPPLRLLIIGAVHIAQPLSTLASHTGYAVTLIDPRDGWASADRFPGFEIDRRMPGEAVAALKPDQRTAIVALCHDPKLDDPGLVEALRTTAFYLGALGSRKNHAGRLGRLAEYGFDEKTLARINGPVGLNIGASTPAEIAVSILAQMTKTLRIKTEK